MNNTVLFSCGNDFAAGTAANLQADASIGRGALVLVDGCMEGEFVSPVIALDDFSTAVCSWNTDVPAGTYSEVFARAQDQEGQ